jgi:hypothetical protein
LRLSSANLSREDIRGVVVSSEEEAQPAPEPEPVQLVKLVGPIQLAQPAQPTPPPDNVPNPHFEYSVCRWPLTNVDGFSSDLDKQTQPIVGFHVSGNCPRCTHATQALFPVEAVVLDETGPRVSSSQLAGGAFRSLQLVPSRSRARKPARDSGKVNVSVLTCQCTNNHQNSKGAFGCGASWLIGATFDLDAKQIKKAEFSPVTAQQAAAVWPAAEAYATSVSGSLKAVQSSAKAWQAALTAILGLVTVVSLIGGRSTLQTLSGADQAWIVVFAAIAVAANAWGIYKSTVSSIGFPVIKPANGALELLNSDLWPLQQTIHAVTNLQKAVLSSAVAFVAGIIAVGFVWLAPTATAPAVPVTLTIRPPTPAPGATAAAPVTVCGVLATPQPTGSPASVAIVPSSTASPAPTVTYPMTSVAGVAPGGC